MIPLRLSLSGFLSYHDAVELDFTSFELACISGSNGAGKSSLLDAITWALFGQARKRDDSVINAQSSAAEVCLVFAYEGNIYRVQRTKPRDKTAFLEFHILQNSLPQSSITNHQSPIPQNAVWKPLTERTLRETETRIQQTLRMDYDTFVNASFFLQGKADQFTQQRPGDRKRILSSILGLEIWEAYRLRAAERRKLIESDMIGIEGRLHEIAAELAEEDARKAHLEQLESDLQRLSQSRLIQETALENIRKVAATLAEQHKLVQALARQWEASTRRLSELELRLASRQAEKDAYAETLGRAGQIEAAHADWQAARAELERWEAVAAQFREHEKDRQGPLDEINAARARLMQELQALQSQKDQQGLLETEISNLKAQISLVHQAQAQAEEKLQRRVQLDADLQAARQRQADARAENPRLRLEMDELKNRINQLEQVEGALCPLCGQPLGEQERQNLIVSLAAQGKDMGDRYRANQALLQTSDGQVLELETQIAALGKTEAELRLYNQTAAQHGSRLELLESQCAAWQATGSVRLNEIVQALEKQDFAPQAYARLRQVDADLKAIGYDAAVHDQVRRAELVGRASDDELRSLEKARAALAPLEREISDLQSQISALQVETIRQQEEHDRSAATLAAAEAQAPDLYTAEREFLNIQEQENLLRLEVGAARQKVLVLDDLKARRQQLDAQREELASQVGQYKQLERAFGKDGVPALLIEQALPQIESKANEILDRLSGGSMTVNFVTQAGYKEKKREDLKETLDIQISDGAGKRDYEMYSGGEAFRVNFAIRLALSEVLAQRAGARLQTLVVDEGFGSQDALGRQRLIEAINLVRPDFAKILVITHIEELKDAFPNRIEVEKTDRGSVVTVI
jgi:exonuclease SbcC